MLPKNINHLLQTNKSGHLDLNNRGLDDEDIQKLYDLLIESTSPIVSINLERNNIQSKGAKIVAQLPSVKKVNLRQNKIDDEGAKAFLNNQKIESLELGINSLTNESAKLLLEKLASENELTYLNISENEKVDQSIIEEIFCLNKGEVYHPDRVMTVAPDIDLGNYTTIIAVQQNIEASINEEYEPAQNSQG